MVPYPSPRYTWTRLRPGPVPNTVPHALMPVVPLVLVTLVGSGGRAVERRTVNREDGGSILPTAVSKLRQFCSPHICLCLSEEALKAGGPFYLVSMPGEVKYPTQGVNV